MRSYLYQAETAIGWTKERYYSPVVMAPLPTILFGESKRAVHVNDIVVAFSDAGSKADREERTFTRVLYPEDRERSEEHLERLIREGARRACGRVPGADS